MLQRLRKLVAGIRQEIAVYRRVLRHPRTPRLAKWLLGLAIGYLLMPFDLIPDWIPVVGQVDDLIIVPGLVILALRLVPRDVIAECRRDAGQPPPGA